MKLDPAIVSVIEDCAFQSHEGTIDFMTVVARLAAVGVESYHADYRQKETIYYLSNDSAHIVELTPPHAAIADKFDASVVQNAVRDAQRGEVKYVDFMDLTMKAGCIGYFVWVAGRHVQYFGRRGEVHTEHFPTLN
jgi:uncharacterized protein YbcV (DUF1398 family)